MSDAIDDGKVEGIGFRGKKNIYTCENPVAQLNTADVPNPSTKSAIHKSNQS